jgi:hypothetical protein
MNYDELLQWVSERGEGSLTAFRQAHDWLATANGHSQHWTWTLQSFQSLGHLEVDWQARRWEVAPSTIATIVSGGGYALLCGARPGWFLRRLDCLDSDPALSHLADSIVLERPVPQDHGPSLRLVTLAEEKDAAEVCKGLGVAYSPFAADELLRLLPDLTQFLRVGRRTDRDLPGGVLPTRMGSGEPGQPLFAEMIEPNDITPGAYCMALFDTRRHFYVHGRDDIFEAGRGEVIYAELRRRGCHVLRWDQRDRSLLVPSRFRLPQLYERAAVLRTGLLPGAEPDPATSPGLVFRYRNVDLRFAQFLGKQLGQIVTVVGTPEAGLGRGHNDGCGTHRETKSSLPTYSSPGRAGALRSAQHSRGGRPCQ